MVTRIKGMGMGIGHGPIVHGSNTKQVFYHTAVMAGNENLLVTRIKGMSMGPLGPLDLNRSSMRIFLGILERSSKEDRFVFD